MTAKIPKTIHDISGAFSIHMFSINAGLPAIYMCEVSNYNDERLDETQYFQT